MISTRTKAKITKESQIHDKDTGSAEVQISIASKRIDELAAHLKKNPKDKHSRKGLLGVVNKRRKLLDYLKKNSPKSYEKLIKRLGLKK